MDQPDKKQLHYERPFFSEHSVENGGFLTHDIRAHACWYYAMLAQKNKQVVGDSIEDQIITYDTTSSEKPLWRNKNYSALAKSVALIYGLESPDVFLAAKEMVIQEGSRCKITFDDEIWRPLLH